jgi:ABC-type transport system substrate-binding protein
VEWLIIPDESTALALYRTGKLDLGPQSNWDVRQQDLEALKQSHPHLIYRDFLGVVPRAVFMRVDQPPFNDVRVRRAISHAIDRQGLIEAIWGRGAPRAEQKLYELTQAQRQAEIVAATATGKGDAAPAQAEGEADALRTKGEAEATSNAKVAASLTPTLIQQQYLMRWNGQLPQYMLGGDNSLLLQLPGGIQK